MAVFAPIPSVSERNVAAAKPGLRRRVRHAYRTSRSVVSTIGTSIADVILRRTVR
jgi:hypothetical protein